MKVVLNPTKYKIHFKHCIRNNLFSFVKLLLQSSDLASPLPSLTRDVCLRRLNLNSTICNLKCCFHTATILSLVTTAKDSHK